MWRAVLEAIGYDYIYVADMYRNAGCNLDRIVVTEGGSKILYGIKLRPTC